MSPTEKTDPRTPGGAADAGTTAPGKPAAAPGPPAASVARPAGQGNAGGSASGAPASSAARPAPAPVGGTAGPAGGAAGSGARPSAAASSAVRQPLVSPARPAASAARPGAAGTAGSAGAATAAATRPVARPAAASPAAPKPADGTAPSTPASDAPRRVRLSLSRVNLWSVARLAFLLSVALGIIAVVVVTLLWAVLNTMGVFTQLDSVISDVVGTESDFRLADLLSLPRVLSVTVFLAVVDVVLVTLVTTIAALLYNLASGLVGGVRLTLSDD